MDRKLILKMVLDVFRVDRIEYPECDVLTFACDNDRYIKYKGKHYSPLIDTVQDALGSRGVTCTSISRIQSVIKGDKSHGRVFSPEGGFIRAMILKRFKGLLWRQGYPFSHAEARVWGKILDQTKPKAVIAILPSRELCAVCRERDIWVADIQHGVIADTHPWYGRDFRGGEPLEWAPNAFLVWNEGTAEIIRKWASPIGVDVHVVGNPWVDRFRHPRPDDGLVNELERTYPLVQNQRPRVLLSLSWGDENAPNGFIHPETERFILDTIDRYDWRFRLHPNQMQGFATDEGDSFKDYYAKTFPQGKIDWQVSSAMPLPLLLAKCDLHVTTHSSVCIEAASFGIRTALTAPTLLPGGKHEDYYEYLVKAGHADKIGQSYAAIFEWFQQNVFARAKPADYYNDAFVNLMDWVEQQTKMNRGQTV